MVKRTIDIVLSSAGLILAAPLLFVISVLIRVSGGSPVFFKQMRVGLNSLPFTIYKFRTMKDKRSGTGKLLPDKDRLFPLGRFLRATSFDELPELLNVLKGDMSMVGPRPLLLEYLERYDEEQRRRNQVKPGITGWAQVNGRNSLSWEEKFMLDLWYVDNQSILLDTKILAMTLMCLIKRKGINMPGEATMPIFIGNKREND